MAADLSPLPAAPGTRWTTGRIVALAAGVFLTLLSLGMVAGGAILAWADMTQLHDGYLATGTARYASPGYALVSDPVELGSGWGWLGRFAGEVRIRVSPDDPAKPVYVAIGPAGEVWRYLAGSDYTTVHAIGDQTVSEHTGNNVPALPASGLPWVARASGTGPQTLHWAVRDGDWAAAVLNSDGSRGVAVQVAAAVSSPMLPWLAGEFLVAGVFTGIPAALLIVVPVRRAARWQVREQAGRRS